MSDVIGIELVGLKSLNAKLDRMEPAVQARIRPFIGQFLIRLREQVKTNILERFKSAGPLYQGVKSETVEQVGNVTGRVYIDDVAYAAIQEYGGTTPPHVILPKNGNVLAFMAGGPLGLSSGGGGNGLVFAKRVNHPGSRIPERTYARLALVQLRTPFEDGIREVVSEGVGDAFAVAAE